MMNMVLEGRGERREEWGERRGDGGDGRGREVGGEEG